MATSPPNARVVSGMRPTGQLHLGNFHGALRNWIELQYQYECFFFVADLHALTTGYEDTAQLEENTWQMLIHDWLGAGLNPRRPARCSSSRRCQSTPNCTCCFR